MGWVGLPDGKPYRVDSGCRFALRARHRCAVSVLVRTEYGARATTFCLLGAQKRSGRRVPGRGPGAFV